MLKAKSIVVVSTILGLSLTTLLTGCDRMNSSSSTANRPADNSTAVETPASDSNRTVGGVIDDSVITTKVKAALLADPDVKSSDIYVETRDGKVLLSGFVNNQTQIHRAIEIAQGIEGVKTVDNKMSVKG